MSLGPWTAPGSAPPPEPPVYPRFQGGYPAPGVAIPDGPGPRRPTPLAAWGQFKPGIVPLRPLALGEILTGGVRLIRFNPSATVGLALITQLLVLVAALPITLLGTRNLADLEDMQPSSVAPLYLAQVPMGIATLVLSALLSHVTLQAVLGHKPDAAATWRAARGRLVPYLGVSFGLILVPVALAGVLVAFTLAAGSQALGLVMLAGLPLGLIGAWVALRLMFLGQVMVVERAGSRAGLRRTWDLTGRRFWPLLGTSLLAGFGANIVASVIETPLTVALMILGALVANYDESLMLTITTTGALLARTASGAVIAPFLAGVTSLLYIDTRMRTEGLDLTLLDEVARDAGA